MVICNHCGREENDELANFCQGCGLILSTYRSGLNATDEKNNQFLRVCGINGHRIQLHNGAKYCKMCGVNLKV